MSKAEYIPLPELDTARFNFPVPPYVDDQERILVNPERLQSLGRLGAFTEVTVASYAGDEPKVNIAISGHGNGVAFGSAAATAQQAETGEGKYSQQTPWQAVPLTIRLNSTEMSEQVQHRGTKKNLPIRSPELWAYECDRAVRKEMRAAAWNHLVVQVDDHALGTFFNNYHKAMLGLLTALEGGIIFLHGDEPKTIAVFGVAVAVNNMRQFNNARRGANPRSEAFSILPLPIDRALIALGAGARPGSIVKIAS